ncbi:MAG: methyltransferase domain-containing protein, partial [Saprospiraceae bacterium]|nr:methyltransferase domain-containing protein [Saprospiraceae bacterium]
MKTEVELKNLVKEKYASIAENPSKGGCCEGDCSSGVAYSFIGEEYKEKEGYVKDADLGLGCGLPTEYAKIKPGNTVVDLGSGAGNDCFIARAEAGAEGQIIGIDFTPQMVAKARDNAARMKFDNVHFYEGEIDNNPLEDNVADVVVSNCVFNLIPNRKKAFQETYRILKPGGHFSISDVIIVGEIPEALREEAELYA